MLGPTISASHVQDPPTLDDKIRIFEDRVLGWQIDVAGAVINGTGATGPIEHSGYAAMSILISYPEMIQQHREGDVSQGSSKATFRRGMADIFRSIDLQNADDVTALNLFYTSVRCGLYHNGMTKLGVLLSGDFDHPVAVDSSRRIVLVNPHRWPGVLQDHFRRFLSELRDPSNMTLRTNFESRFDVHLTGQE